VGTCMDTTSIPNGAFSAHASYAAAERDEPKPQYSTCNVTYPGARSTTWRPPIHTLFSPLSEFQDHGIEKHTRFC
jgi:hypothetical protein